MRLAVVEDDDGVGDALVAALTARGYHVDRKRRGAELLASYHDYDAVILDLGLPDIDGLEVLRRLRQVSSVPVLILTARGGEHTIVTALRGGADDYLVKPPRIAELAARLETVTRRAGPREPTPVDVVTEDVRVDLVAHQVVVAGSEIPLTPKEFQLVQILVERPGTAVSRQQMMDRIWGDSSAAVSRVLDVHMAGLRAKLGRPGLIVTIRGFGYRWGAA
ncbi:response regulator transcription factor [Nocardia iowensis]|uniref:Response regulator transcription factor n=1 Tax=Nocardia iowensis TaxID=204891 RepID=A0ABX8RY71_NOCIO|nr:response regulator transcription factor [Nocardia iowensis]QXN92491.1 response regulator transcription factor [Nocardia iowensis]